MALIGTLGLLLGKTGCEKWQWSQLSYTSVGCISQSPPEAADLTGKWQASGFRLFEEQLQPQYRTIVGESWQLGLKDMIHEVYRLKGEKREGLTMAWCLVFDQFCALISVCREGFHGPEARFETTLLFTIIIELPCANHLTSARLGLRRVKKLSCVKALADDSPSQRGYFLNCPSVPGT